MTDNEQKNAISEETESINSFNLTDFITKHSGVKEPLEGAKEEPDDPNSVRFEPLARPEPLKEVPPKAGQKYWLSAEAKKKKNEYMRGYYIRKKEILQELQRHQIKPRDLKLLNINDRVITRHLETEADYIKIIEDLLGTLTDNRLLKDFQLIELP